MNNEQTEIDWSEEKSSSEKEQQALLHSFQHYCKEVNKLTVEYDEQALKLKAIKKDIELILIDKLPILFSELGLDNVVLESGKKISIKEFFSPKILDFEKFAEYLKDNDEEAIIKHYIGITLPRGSSVVSKTINTFLEALPVIFEDSESIHAQTLLKWVKEKLKADEELPACIKPNKFTRAVIK